MRTNKKVQPVTTHEGAPAKRITPLQELRRSVLSTFLFEDQFYENGQSIAARITALSAQVRPQDLAALTIEARTTHNLRHVSLLLCISLIRQGATARAFVANTVDGVIQRADELAELLALYWKEKKQPLTKQMKIGLGRAFNRFSAYQLAKYNRMDRQVKLRDVLFLCHAKPKDEKQANIFRQLVENKLPVPDTWEVELSAGKDKKATFERLITEDKLGYLALLRNLRNMEQAGCDRKVVGNAILARKNGADRVLPFRFVAAARHAPSYEKQLDNALCAVIDTLPELSGTTFYLVDISGSMNWSLSSKSELNRIDAAATLVSMHTGDARLFLFNNDVREVPHRRGMAGVDVIKKAVGGGTRLGNAVAHLNKIMKPEDRLIVLTDEQSQDRVPDPAVKKAYLINVASARTGVGYGPWIHVDGFSEAVLTWIRSYEELGL